AVRRRIRHDPQQPAEPDCDARDAVLAVHGAACRRVLAAGGGDGSDARAHLEAQAARGKEDGAEMSRKHAVGFSFIKYSVRLKPHPQQMDTAVGKASALPDAA